MWMTFRNLMLNAMRKTQKTTCYMIPLIGNSWDTNTERGRYTDCWLAELREAVGLTIKWYEILFFGDDSI